MDIIQNTKKYSRERKQKGKYERRDPSKREVKPKKKKIIIEIKSRRNGWTAVELLSIKKGNRMLIRFLSGDTVIRKIKKVRWGKTKRVG